MKKLILILALLCGALFAPAAHADVTFDEANGKTVQFSVMTDGTAPFTYQWSKDGVAIAGATSATFTITGVKAADQGTYSVQVANKAGSTVSDKAVFSVTVNPTTAKITVKTL